MNSGGSADSLRTIRGFVFDMDGVIFRGDVALPGAVGFTGALRDAGVPFLFMTNNSTTPAAKVVARLERMGISASVDQVITSSDVTAAVMAREMPGARALVVGEEGISCALATHGFRLVDDHREADLVVVGMDRRLTYALLQEAALAVRRGAALIATNIDRTLPTDIGEIPGAGSLVAALEVATGVRARSFGKPEPDMYLHALPRLGLPPHLVAAVGDRPETDILGGQRAGLRTVGVLSGAGTPTGFAAMHPGPDWVFADVDGLRKAYLGD